METDHFSTEERTEAHQPLSHTVRTADGGKTTVKLTRGAAIKLMCMECMGWDTHPKDCTSVMCPLFPYRGRTDASRHGDA